LIPPKEDVTLRGVHYMDDEDFEANSTECVALLKKSCAHPPSQHLCACVPLPLPTETKPERLGVYIEAEHCLFLQIKPKTLFH